MSARRILYCILSAWSGPWFWLEAVEQHRLVTTQGMEDAPHHYAMYALTKWIFVGCVPFAIAAIALSIFLWRTSSRVVRAEIVAWFGLLLLLMVFMVLAPSMFGLSYTTVRDRSILGWIQLGLEGTLLLSPLVFLVASMTRSRPTDGR
jgi:hypothetical protein